MFYRRLGAFGASLARQMLAAEGGRSVRASRHGLGAEGLLVLVAPGLVARFAFLLRAGEVALARSRSAFLGDLRPTHLAVIPFRVGREAGCLLECHGEGFGVALFRGRIHVLLHPALQWAARLPLFSAGAAR